MHTRSLLLTAVLLLLASSAHVLAGGVTNIKEVVNNSRSKVVKVTAYDAKIAPRWQDPKQTTGIITYGNTWSGDMWVPWADNEDDFKGHFMSIEIIELRPTRSTDIHNIYVLYQSGEYVRMSYFGMIEQRGFGHLLQAVSFQTHAEFLEKRGRAATGV